MKNQTPIGRIARYVAALLVLVLVGCDSQSGLVEEKVLPPSAPVQSLPRNGADDVADDLALEWSTAEQGTVFHVVVATDPDFADIRAEVPNVVDPRYVLTDLQIGGTYWWRVRAVNSAGTSPWSETWTFSPDRKGIVPDIPALVAPLPDTITQLEVIVYWSGVPGAVSYDLQVAQEDVFVRMDVDRSAIENTQRELDNLIYGYEYFWRVRSRNYSGVSAWSQPRRFEVTYDPTGS